MNETKQSQRGFKNISSRMIKDKVDIKDSAYGSLIDRDMIS